MKQVYILSEEEYAMVQGQAKYIETLQNENANLSNRLSRSRERNSSFQQEVNKLHQECAKRCAQISQLEEQLKNSYMEVMRVRTNGESEIKRLNSVISEMKRDMEGMSRTINKYKMLLEIAKAVASPTKG